jgi:nucleoside-diphosphate-sugar epimerase
MGKKARLFKCPPGLLRAVAAALGRRSELQRLTTNLRVDFGEARNILGWRPTKELQGGVNEMVNWFVAHSRPI